MQASPEPAQPRRPAPILTDDNAFYWEAAADGKLVAQRCGNCGVMRHPPRPMCPHCQSLAIDVVPLSKDDPRGAVLASAALPLVFGGMIIAVVVALLLGMRPTWRMLTSLVVVSAVTGLAAYLVAQAWLGALPG